MTKQLTTETSKPTKEQQLTTIASPRSKENRLEKLNQKAKKLMNQNSESSVERSKIVNEALKAKNIENEKSGEDKGGERLEENVADQGESCGTCFAVFLRLSEE
jgi:hypothetical protein